MNAQTLKVEEAAEILRLSRTAAYAAVRRGDIPSIRIGKLLFVPKPALDVMLLNAGNPAKVVGETNA
ncbi:MAG: helix-turn-helix domain-containing protein [Armatimonadota bacterium]|nr:helix-turn-helix domain-containing protein [bacterium]